ncbi:hypothetical protein BLNAU_11518 [Blattamonas nauphoetae]|uniref:Uncharacterized protein n=1 Tax=Blattamonas nauphoetae TaxID=2049346 RepID=A0ABQ9XM75_9EUKA|nr:hypothetical protein BLNAU_11518 [Blattamonas nauphoetae]
MVLGRRKKSSFGTNPTVLFLNKKNAKKQRSSSIPKKQTTTNDPPPQYHVFHFILSQMRSEKEEEMSELVKKLHTLSLNQIHDDPDAQLAQTRKIAQLSKEILVKRESINRIERSLQLARTKPQSSILTSLLHDDCP